jgi:hypothetical protein
MAYFEQHGAMHSWLGKPAAPVLGVVCDACAESVVPFDRTKRVGSQHWDTGWKWAPHYGAPCGKCGKAT